MPKMLTALCNMPNMPHAQAATYEMLKFQKCRMLYSTTCKHAKLQICQHGNMPKLRNVKRQTCPNANMPKHNHVKTQISQMQSYQNANKQMQTRQTAYLPQCFPTMQIFPKSTCQHENMPKCQIKACKNSIYSKL